MTLDLVFQTPFPESSASPVNVIFGSADGVEDARTNTAAIDAAFAALTANFRVGQVLPARIVASFPALQLTATGTYASLAARPTVGQVQAHHQVAQPVEQGPSSRYSESLRTPSGVDSLYSPAAPLKASIGVGLVRTFVHSRRGYVPTFARAEKVQPQQHGDRFANMLHGFRPAYTSAYQETIRVGYLVQSFERNALHDRRSSVSTAHQVAHHAGTALSTDYQAAIGIVAGRTAKSREAIRPPAGIYTGVVIVTPPQTNECYVPPIGIASFVFRDTIPGTPYLVFACDDQSVGPGPAPQYTIPVRRVYFVLNDISFTRVSDGEPIAIIGGSTTTDRDSWTWGFNATLPFRELAKIEPTADGPVEVELALNGFKWRFLVEDHSYGEAFNANTLSISGRSLTAVMDEPYAAKQSLVQTEATTARQLADNELARYSAAQGFTLDWSLIDPLGWQVPANSWSYQDLTPIAALKAIAESVGGYVQSDPLLPKFLVQSGYPTSSWEWPMTSADIALPRSILLSQSHQWSEKPLYTGLYVSGEKTGAVTFVKRAGTAGDFQAPMYVNALVTDAAATREYGRGFLSSGGKQASVSVTLPMSNLTSLFTPGKLIEFTGDGFKGLVRGVTVDFSLDSRLAKITQSATIERHYTEA